ncbi:deoxyribodipyrimidine photo-lyase [Novosphingobium sp. PS1R-30]|uniref:Deoxyribodipyrimidine photo-lyase n=1 Tax=Novosphingobium anseongense TaxID=3133436 RepID=A0ABU8RT60_9SPHN
MTAPVVVWLRRDLRLADQPALSVAASEGPVIPVFVLDDEIPGDRKLGGASRWWLHHSLEALARSLGRHRSKLILRRGDSVAELVKLAKETGAKAVHAIAHHEPWWREAEEALARKLDLHIHDGNYLLPPGAVTTGSGSPYKIYTPFAKVAIQRLPERDPLDEPALTSPATWPKSDELADWNLLPTRPDWAAGLRKDWVCGEAAAHDTLDEFLHIAPDYERDRNLPSIAGTSRLSPHLHWGEISPTQVWHALAGKRGEGVSTFRGELLWRDYAQTVIWQFPDYAKASYRHDFRHLKWRRSKEDLAAWQQGRTGYPLVDAGMRQLWTTGWMHNRVRMIAASFLIKHLLIDWREGERWFWDTLVDADYANNAVNWQWVAGSGVDANLFTRIMAPLTQSPKFDAAGYIREWVPELADLSDADIHDPPDEQRGGYPAKIIGHREARERALGAYRAMKTTISKPE